MSFRAHDDAVVRFAFSHNGRHIITSGTSGEKDWGDEGELRVWDVHTGQLVADVSGLDQPVHDIGTCRGDSCVAVSGCTVSVRNGLTLSVTQEWRECDLGMLYGVAVNDDGSAVAVAGHGGMRARDIVSQRVIAEALDVGPSTQVAWLSPEATDIVFNSEDEVYVSSASGDSRRLTSTHGADTCPFAVSYHNSQIVIGCGRALCVCAIEDTAR
jgi:WD40 repeat protein